MSSATIDEFGNLIYGTSTLAEGSIGEPVIAGILNSGITGFGATVGSLPIAIAAIGSMSAIASEIASATKAATGGLVASAIGVTADPTFIQQNIGIDEMGNLIFGTNTATLGGRGEETITTTTAGITEFGGVIQLISVLATATGNASISATAAELYSQAVVGSASISALATELFSQATIGSGAIASSATEIFSQAFAASGAIAAAGWAPFGGITAVATEIFSQVVSGSGAITASATRQLTFDPTWVILQYRPYSYIINTDITNPLQPLFFQWTQQATVMYVTVAGSGSMNAIGWAPFGAIVASATELYSQTVVGSGSIAAAGWAPYGTIVASATMRPAFDPVWTFLHYPPFQLLLSEPPYLGFSSILNAQPPPIATLIATAFGSGAVSVSTSEIISGIFAGVGAIAVSGWAPFGGVSAMATEIFSQAAPAVASISATETLIASSVVNLYPQIEAVATELFNQTITGSGTIMASATEIASGVLAATGSITATVIGIGNEIATGSGAIAASATELFSQFLTAGTATIGAASVELYSQVVLTSGNISAVESIIFSQIVLGAASTSGLATEIFSQIISASENIAVSVTELFSQSVGGVGNVLVTSTELFSQAMLATGTITAIGGNISSILVSATGSLTATGAAILSESVVTSGTLSSTVNTITSQITSGLGNIQSFIIPISSSVVSRSGSISATQTFILGTPINGNGFISGSATIQVGRYTTQRTTGKNIKVDRENKGVATQRGQSRKNVIVKKVP
jgi:hypothetical protein